MTSYRYTAIDQVGKTISGSIEGDSLRQVRQLLQQQQLAPLEIEVATKNHSRTRVLTIRSEISLTDLALMTRQFSTLIAAGMPVAQALQAVSEQVSKPSLQRLVQRVRDKVMEGYPLAKALGQYPDSFSDLYCATVAAGEQTGRLDLILTRLAEYLEQQHSMRRKIQLAMIYPTIMTVISAAIVAFLLVFVVPRIIDVFTSTGQDLPQLTRVLIFFSDALRQTWLLLLTVLFGIIIIAKQSLRNVSVKKRLHQFLWQLPFVGFTIASVNSARFNRTLGILLTAGVDLIQALRVAAALVAHIPMREAIVAATDRVAEGTALHLALRHTNCFSPMVSHLIANGENSGRLSEMLEYVAEYQDSEVKRLIDTSLALFEPLLILIMGFVVLFIVLAILLPIFELGQIVT